MKKVFVIARREFLAAVKSKGFIVSIILMPILMGGGIIAQKAVEKVGDRTTKRIAVIDRTPGATLYDEIVRKAAERNEKEIFDKASGRQMEAKFEFEKIAPAEGEAAINRQRLELSDRVRREELIAFIEIGPDVIKPRLNPATVPSNAAELKNASDQQLVQAAGEILGDNAIIRYSTNRPTYGELRRFLARTLAPKVYALRGKEAGLDPMAVYGLIIPPQIVDKGLVRTNAEGKVVDEGGAAQMVAAFAVPLILLMLMFMIVMVGCSPLTANVIEEKQLRIVEVLLGSVSPFQLMMGKLLGGVGVALVLAMIYLGGGYWLAAKMGYADYVSKPVLAWFFVYTVLAVLMYGAMFLAVGSACSNIKESQSMIMPVMIFIILPLLMLGPILQDPSGPVPTIGSFIPFCVPLMMTVRMAIPPGIPQWQAVAGIAIALATVPVIVWAAGRIFRVGILMQGQGAKLGQMIRWIVAG